MKSLLSRICIAIRNRGGHIRPRAQVLGQHDVARIQEATSAIAARTSAAPLTGSSLLVVGLGDPESNHLRRPHNIGYRFVDSLALARGSRWQERPEGLVSTIDVDGVAVMLLKPGAGTDSVGSLVRRLIARTGLHAANCVVVHDDTDLELGTARKRRAGGAAGHKGVQSVIAALGTYDFPGIRIGVRKPGDPRKAKDLVVLRFSRKDETVLALALEQANVAMRAFAKEHSSPRAISPEPAP